jgi:hypothetical protein
MRIVIRRPAIVIIAALAMIVALAGMKAVPAYASSGDFCVQGPYPYPCLNDWNNAGPSNSNEIRMYTAGAANEAFTLQPVTGRCGGYVTVSPACPFSNSYFDSYYEGFPIDQLQYNGGSNCLATGSTADGTNNVGVLGKCNNTGSGSGGSNGTLFVDHGGYMINVYWTNQNQYGDNAACMEPEGSYGTNSFVYLDLPTGDGCALWAPEPG